MDCIRMDEERYPEKLKHIIDPPETLYVEGNVPDGTKPAVAIIGARNCSEYGRQVAREFGYYLAKEGVDIISGMALGIDAEAQKGALLGGGNSYGILGCGVDICYPRNNRDLYEQLKVKGGVISEHPAGTPPLAAYFPQRNRIISGLSDVVLVVEAKEKSGTGYTVRMALEQGKDVFAVPGRVTDAVSTGCNRLIAEGAGVAISPETVLEAAKYNFEMNGQREIRKLMPVNHKSMEDSKKEKLKCLPKDEKEIVLMLNQRERTLEDILSFYETDVSTMMIKLLEMEQKGLIEERGAYYFSKVV